MPIDNTYAYLGASAAQANSDEAIRIPSPTVGDAPFKTVQNALVETNANGQEIRHKIGAEIIEMQFGWGLIEAETWWEIGRFFAEVGDIVYCRFFHHTLGEWQTKQFCRQGRECNPIVINGETGRPEYYEGAHFVLRSTGR